MPTINWGLVEKAKWPFKHVDTKSAALEALCRPVTLRSLYPPIEREIDGVYHKVKTILPHQQMFHSGISLCGKYAKNILLAGGVGSGKSISASVEVVQGCLNNPGLKVVCILPLDYYLTESVRPTLDKVIDTENSIHVRGFNMRTQTLNFMNGSSVRFKAYDDAEKIKGWDAHWIWFEELSELADRSNEKKMAVYLACLMRLRGIGYPTRIIATMNPLGHDAAWKIFIQRSPQAKNPDSYWVPMCDKRRDFLAKPENRNLDYKNPREIANQNECNKCSLTCKKECRHYPITGQEIHRYEYITPTGDIFYTITTGSAANPFNPPGYVETMIEQMSQDPLTRRRMVEGRFDSLNQLIYDKPNYSVDWNVVTWEEVAAAYGWNEEDDWWPNDWPVVIGIDVGGHVSPYAFETYLYDEKENWAFCIDEVYKPALRWDEVAAILKKMAKPFRNVRFVIDPKSGPRKEGATQESVIEELRKYGLYIQVAEGYQKGFYRTVQTLLHPDPLYPHPFIPDEQYEDQNGITTWKLGRPSLFYIGSRECTHPRRTSDNPNGCDCACPMNLKEKSVWRVNQKRLRAPKESEEGLTPQAQETPVDTDDHAQTAEMFAVKLIGFKGLDPETRRRRPTHRKPMDPLMLYGRGE